MFLLWLIYKLYYIYYIYYIMLSVVFLCLSASSLLMNWVLSLPQRLVSAVVTHSSLTATVGWTLSLGHIWGVFHPHSQCLVVFPSGFSSTLRKAQNCSVWNRLIRPTGLARTSSGRRKINGFTHFPLHGQVQMCSSETVLYPRTHSWLDSIEERTISKWTFLYCISLKKRKTEKSSFFNVNSKLQGNVNFHWKWYRSQLFWIYFHWKLYKMPNLSTLCFTVKTRMPSCMFIFLHQMAAYDLNIIMSSHRLRIKTLP